MQIADARNGISNLNLNTGPTPTYKPHITESWLWLPGEATKALSLAFDKVVKLSALFVGPDAKYHLLSLLLLVLEAFFYYYAVILVLARLRRSWASGYISKYLARTRRDVIRLVNWPFGHANACWRSVVKRAPSTYSRDILWKATGLSTVLTALAVSDVLSTTTNLAGFKWLDWAWNAIKVTSTRMWTRIFSANTNTTSITHSKSILQTLNTSSSISWIFSQAFRCVKFVPMHCALFVARLVARDEGDAVYAVFGVEIEEETSAEMGPGRGLAERLTSVWKFGEVVQRQWTRLQSFVYNKILPTLNTTLASMNTITLYCTRLKLFTESPLSYARTTISLERPRGDVHVSREVERTEMGVGLTMMDLVGLMGVVWILKDVCDAVIDAAVPYAVKGSESVFSLVLGGAVTSQTVTDQRDSADFARTTVVALGMTMFGVAVVSVLGKVGKAVTSIFEPTGIGRRMSGVYARLNAMPGCFRQCMIHELFDAQIVRRKHIKIRKAALTRAALREENANLKEELGAAKAHACELMERLFEVEKTCDEIVCEGEKRRDERVNELLREREEEKGAYKARVEELDTREGEMVDAMVDGLVNGRMVLGALEEVREELARSREECEEEKARILALREELAAKTAEHARVVSDKDAELETVRGLLKQARSAWKQLIASTKREKSQLENELKTLREQRTVEMAMLAESRVMEVLRTEERDVARRGVEEVRRELGVEVRRVEEELGRVRGVVEEARRVLGGVVRWKGVGASAGAGEGEGESEDARLSCKSDVNITGEADSSHETLVEQEVASGTGLKDHNIEKVPQDAKPTGTSSNAHTMSATYELTKGRAGALYASTKDDFGDFSASVVSVDPLFSSAI